MSAPRRTHGGERVEAPAVPTAGERAWWRRGALVVAALAVLSYLPALRNGFVWDDRYQVIQNEVLHAEHPVAEAFRRDFWALHLGMEPDHRASEYYRPLVTLSFLLDFKLGGLAPLGYHATNILLHLAVTLALLLAARRFGLSAREAVWAAALFAVHPVHVESVAWVSGRTDTLCAAFLLSALAARGPAAWPLGAAALLSKETAVVWPLLAALRDRRWVWRERLPELVLVVGYLALRRVILGATLTHAVTVAVPEALAGSLHMLGLFAAPWLAAPVYDAPLALRQIAPAAVAGPLLLGLLGVVAWRQPRHRWWLAPAAVSYAPGLAVLATTQTIGPRLLYVPSAFLCLTAGVALARLSGRLAPAAAAAGVVALAGSTAWGTTVWKSEYVFWGRAARGTAPVAAYINFAAAQHDEGDLAGAWESLGTAARREPTPEGHYLRGLVLSELGCAGAAADAYRRAIAVRPRYAAAWGNLAALLRVHGRPRDAEAVAAATIAAGIDTPALRRVLAKAQGDPRQDRALPGCARPMEELLVDPAALKRAALARGRDGEAEQGEIVALAAVRLRPDDAEAWHTLGQLRYLKADFRGAVRAGERALALDPGQTRAWKLLGLGYLKAGDASRGREYLGKYLARHPDAPDAAELRSLVESQ